MPSAPQICGVTLFLLLSFLEECVEAQSDKAPAVAYPDSMFLVRIPRPAELSAKYYTFRHQTLFYRLTTASICRIYPSRRGEGGGGRRRRTPLEKRNECKHYSLSRLEICEERFSNRPEHSVVFVKWITFSIAAVVRVRVGAPRPFSQG